MSEAKVADRGFGVGDVPEAVELSSRLHGSADGSIISALDVETYV